MDRNGQQSDIVPSTYGVQSVRQEWLGRGQFASFVHALGTDSDNAEMVQTIIALGRSMDIDAVAEGVETAIQLEHLRQLGTRYAQGYIFSMPLDAEGTTALIADS